MPLPNIDPPLRDSWRQVDADSWVIGGKLLLSRSREATGSSGCSWSDDDGNFYTISEVDEPLRKQQRAPFPLVYDAGEMHVVWEIGNAFLKLIVPTSPHATREHVTLDAVRRWDRDFALPNVLFHGEWDNRYYILVSKVAGQSLHNAWPLMSEESKQDCVTRVAKICKQLAVHEGESIHGVDGQHLPEYYLLTSTEHHPDCSPEVLLASCQDIGLDCSSFVFFHCDLGPGNISVDVADGSLSIIDWECAGFVPREWIRTKFRVCGGMDFELPMPARIEWRKRVQLELEKMGFVDLADEWMAWIERQREVTKSTTEDE